MKVKKFTPRVLQVTHIGEARQYLEDIRNADRLYTCEHGHTECATIEGGPCSDEIATIFNFEG